MTPLFIACAAFGAMVLAAQIALSLFGLDGAHEGSGDFHIGDASIGEGLELLSVRSVGAGTAFFGIAGLGAQSIGLPGILALPIGLATGIAALFGTAILMRQILRLESDGSLRIEGTIGLSGTVYLTIPAGQAGPGKVHLLLQGRTLELAAVTTADTAIPTGAPVVVVSVVDSETVEVLPASLLQEVLDDNS